MDSSIIGLVRIRVCRGIKLANRDVTTDSDPYIVFTMGLQKVKTRVVKDDSNPEWNEELAMSVKDPDLPISLSVYDKDNITADDKMGDAEFDLRTLIECVKRGADGLSEGSIVERITPCSENDLADTSYITWQSHKMIQDMRLRLRNVECGEVEIQTEWVDLIDSSAYNTLERQRALKMDARLGTSDGSSTDT